MSPEKPGAAQPTRADAAPLYRSGVAIQAGNPMNPAPSGKRRATSGRRVIRLSRAEARRLLVRYHFAPTTLAGVFERHTCVQADPLNPVGRNHDLVLQARVPEYRVGDWEHHAYTERRIYDGWDKQACLVRMEDWPVRRIYHRWRGTHWKPLFKTHAKARKAVLAELERRGPLTSAAFEHQVRVDRLKGSWYGPQLTKNILRALWDSGVVVTHHRENGHHAYDLAERVIPPQIHGAARVPPAESVRRLIRFRHQAMGLLRPAGAPLEIWSMPLTAAERNRRIDELLAAGDLVAVEVEGRRFHAPPAALAQLEQEEAGDPRVVFLAPLDPLLWDRRMVAELFGFDYVWEVYKPEPQRRWGYYVLPVLYGDQFVARFEARLERAPRSGKSKATAGRPTTQARKTNENSETSARTLCLKGWWWEDGVIRDAALHHALAHAVSRFCDYLASSGIRLECRIDVDLKKSWQG